MFYFKKIKKKKKKHERYLWPDTEVSGGECELGAKMKKSCNTLVFVARWPGDMGKDKVLLGGGCGSGVERKTHTHTHTHHTHTLASETNLAAKHLSWTVSGPQS